MHWLAIGLATGLDIFTFVMIVGVQLSVNSNLSFKKGDDMKKCIYSIDITFSLDLLTNAFY